MRTEKQRNLVVLPFVMLIVLAVSGCETLGNLFQPTTVDRVEYVPTPKPEWEDETIFIDFDAGYVTWYYAYASQLSETIRDQLIEDIVEDGIFKVQDRRTGADYLYKVEVRIENPLIEVSNDVIQSISATFNVRTYDREDNLVTAKTREVRYDAPAFNVTVNDSQRELVDNYAYNAAQQIRREVYESFE